MNRTRLVTFAALLLTAIIPVAATATATASAESQRRAGSTCGTSGNWFAGYNSNSGSAYRGAKAEIDFQNPDLCGDDTSGPSFSVAWPMILAPAANVNRTMYAQVGYGQFAYNNADIASFYQYSLKCKASTAGCSGDSEKTDFDLDNPGPSWGYRVWRGSDGLIEMRAGPAGGNGINAKSGYDPLGDWSNSWQTQFNAETHHQATDVVGVTNDRTLFDGIRYYQTSTSSWEPIAKANLSGSSPTTSRYNKSELSQTSGEQHYHFTVWTDPL